MSKKKDNNKVLLSENEVVETLEAVQRAFDVLDFAKGYNDGVYSPMTQNTLMKNINISSIVMKIRRSSDMSDIFVLKGNLNRGSLQIEYFSGEDLERLYSIFTKA